MSENIKTNNRLELAQFKELAGKPMQTVRSWAHRYAADLDARRIAGRITVDADRARTFLQGSPLAADGRDAA